MSDVRRLNEVRPTTYHGWVLDGYAMDAFGLTLAEYHSAVARGILRRGGDADNERSGDVVDLRDYWTVDDAEALTALRAELRLLERSNGDIGMKPGARPVRSWSEFFGAGKVRP